MPLEASLRTDNDEKLPEVAPGVVGRLSADSAAVSTAGMEKAKTMSTSLFCGCMLRRRASALFLSLLARGMLLLYFSTFVTR